MCLFLLSLFVLLSVSVAFPGHMHLLFSKHKGLILIAELGKENAQPCQKPLVGHMVTCYVTTYVINSASYVAGPNDI